MTDPNDPALKSFVPVPDESHFPIQNLPFGVFRPRGGAAPRVGVAIGEMVLDLAVLEARGLLPLENPAGPFFSRPSLNAFLSLGHAAWSAVRRRVSELLRDAADPHGLETLRNDAALRAQALLPQADVHLLLPAEIGDYTDFYSSRHHATNVGTMIRGPEQALQENWLHLPVAYHGRASSVVVSGTGVRRPLGQTGPGRFGPSRALDFELELGFLVGPGNPLGEPIAIDTAEQHIFGLVLVNDWSARDIQKWEYVPLGPFLAKNFATSVSPWVVTLDALQPFRHPNEPQDPSPLPYLQTRHPWSLDIELEVSLSTEAAAPVRITRSNFRHLYWNIAQQLAHHTVNGCNVRPGDLMGSGTVSGPDKNARGCLLELTWGGKEPLEVAGLGRRVFLEDGDRVTMTGWAQADGYRIGFGEITGQVLPAIDR